MTNIDYDALARRIAVALMSGRELASMREATQSELYYSLLVVIGSDSCRRCSWRLEELTLFIASHLREALPTSEAKILTPDQVERARTILVCKQGHQQAIGGPGWKDYWMDSVAELLREVVGDE